MIINKNILNESKSYLINYPIEICTSNNGKDFIFGGNTDGQTLLQQLICNVFDDNKTINEYTLHYYFTQSSPNNCIISCSSSVFTSCPSTVHI